VAVPFDLKAFQLVNSLGGRSWLLDSLISLSSANDLIKSAPVGACFCAAWYFGRNSQETTRARRALLIGLVAAFLALTTTTILSHTWFVPRPYLRTHDVYTLQDDHLQPVPKIEFRQPLDNRAVTRAKEASRGNVPPDDFGSLPSDHAGFFFGLSLAIVFASRRIGLMALAWTLLIILPGKVIPGMHTPGEIGLGCLIAAAWLAACHLLARTRLRWFEVQLVSWSQRHSAWGAAMLFLVVFEISSKLDHVKSLLEAVGKHV